MKQRKLINGKSVNELDVAIGIVIFTKSPAKWKIVDMETGEEYVGSETKHPFFNNFLKEKIQSMEIGSLMKVKGVADDR